MANFPKYVVGAIMAVILLLLVAVVYRMYFMFNRAKVEAWATAVANQTASPNIAYRIIIEGCENILKSQDLTAQVKLLAEADGIEKEQALVLTALNNCYASGFIATPASTEPTPTDNE